MAWAGLERVQPGDSQTPFIRRISPWDWSGSLARFTMGWIVSTEVFKFEIEVGLLRRWRDAGWTGKDHHPVAHCDWSG